MKKQFYLNISLVNLVYYFKTGLIKPSKYFEEWAEDRQSKYNNSLLFLYSNSISCDECSLEIVLNSEEKNQLVQIDDFSLMNKPLPISRIRNIYFPTGKSKQALFNIETADGFVNMQTVNEIKPIEKPIEIPNFEDDTKNWEIKNRLFDRILGGFAVMKIAKHENFDEYSKHYFNYLAHINKKVEVNKNIEFKDTQLKAIKINNDIPEADIIFKNVDLESVNHINKGKEEIKKDKFTDNILLDQITNEVTYIMAVLSQYGDDFGKSYKIADFMSDIIEGKFRPETKEKLCLTFGINQGYSSFKNAYHINDHILEIKFKLDSELDYSIIESVYQYIFNDRTDNSSFDYINTWCPKFKNSVDENTFDTITVFDKKIIVQKKTGVGSQKSSKNSQNKLSNIENKTEADTDDKIKVKQSEALKERINKIENINKIGELKTIAKYLGIKNYSKFKKENTSELKDLIIKKEKSILN